MKRLWRLLMRVLFLTPRRPPVEVVMRLNQYEHERKLRLEGYAETWRKKWAQREVAEARRSGLWMVKR